MTCSLILHELIINYIHELIINYIMYLKMKKIYMQPQTAILKVELTGVLLQASTVGFNSDPDKALGSGDILTKEQQDWDIWNE